MQENRLIIRSAGRTHTGKVRKHNEDCIYLDKKNRFFLVADGVGGKDKGELASLSACNYLYVQFENLLKILDKNTPSETVNKKIVKIVKDSSKYVKKMALTESPEGMGTTLSGVLFFNNNAWVFNVGDSRCYYSHKDRWQQITKDDSLMQSLLDKGVLKEEQKETFPYKNVITQALGLTSPISVQVYHLKIFPKDFFIISSDGFHGLIPDKKWQKKFSSPLTSASIDRLVEKYVESALRKGGTDNISIIGIGIRK